MWGANAGTLQPLAGGAMVTCAPPRTALLPPPRAVVFALSVTPSTPLGDSREDLHAAPGWTLALWQRLRVRLGLKLVGTTAFMWLFFIAYFELLRNPARPVTVMPLVWLDHAVPFQPGAFWAYVSLWFYVGIPAGLMLRVRDGLLYGAWGAALCITGLVIFWLWPTAVPAGWQPSGLSHHAGLALIQGVDAAGNACPSLHVAGAVFTAFWVRRVLHQVRAPRWVHVANAAWLVLIVHSTLALRQHVALDVAGGVLLALPFAWASLRFWRPGPR
jgi:hypothetical protein